MRTNDRKQAVGMHAVGEIGGAGKVQAMLRPCRGSALLLTASFDQLFPRDSLLF